MDRAPDYGSGGWGFEFLRVHEQIKAEESRQSERQKGKIRNNEELAQAFIADFDLVGIRGVDREKLNQAFRMGIAKLENFESFEIGKVVKDIQAASKELGIDATLIHYAPRDNVLWFPDSMGDGGPDAFRVEVQNPPAFEIRDI